MNLGRCKYIGNIENVRKHHLKIIKFIVQSTGDLVSGQIQIQVSFSPKIISLQKSSIKTGQGLIAEITCTVTGEPKPKVTWYKGDEVIIVIRMVFMYFNICFYNKIFYPNLW